MQHCAHMLKEQSVSQPCITEVGGSRWGEWLREFREAVIRECCPGHGLSVCRCRGIVLQSVFCCSGLERLLTRTSQKGIVKWLMLIRFFALCFTSSTVNLIKHRTKQNAFHYNTISLSSENDHLHANIWGINQCLLIILLYLTLTASFPCITYLCTCFPAAHVLYFCFCLVRKIEDEGGSGPSLHDLNMWSSKMETGNPTMGP